jgi:hypothetical protein
MNFEEREIQELDLTDVYNFVNLIVNKLCGQVSKGLYEEEMTAAGSLGKLLSNLISNIKQNKLNYEQFNEIMLLLNQDRVEKAFFNFFFEREKDKISLNDIRKGVIRFRGYAMLCFGNFRFAYKQLITKKSVEDINESLESYCIDSIEAKNKLNNRPIKMIEIDRIAKDKTWYLGETTGNTLQKESEILLKEFKKKKNSVKNNKLLKFANLIVKMAKEMEKAQDKGLKNTDIYLTWDYMDVYIATSMRNKWEFEETYDFINYVFNDNRLKNLRYFDPTQCICANPKDKGLIEGLMLKRAACTIYMAQESDTMGKDSELAATLAQSKPVIAYVPKYESDEEIKEYANKISKYPLKFFKSRLLILEAEEIFDDLTLIKKLRLYEPDFEEIIDAFRDKFAKYRKKQPFSLWFNEDNKEFKKDSDFSKICLILAIAESFNFERRANLLKERHPLAMQVDLQSGVANGVLVVRSPKECRELLYKILTSSLEFIIQHEGEEGKGYYILREKTTMSPFRIVTNYEKLTNSFWNLFS